MGASSSKNEENRNDGEDGGRRLWSDSKSELDDEAVGGRRLGNEFISYLDDGAVGGRRLGSESKSDLNDEAVGGRRLGSELISYLDDGEVGGRRLGSESKSELDDGEVGGRRLGSESKSDLDIHIVRALYDFDAIHDDDLSFKKDDKFNVEENTAPNSDWWVATHISTGQKGYIPSDYVIKDDNSPQSQDWWYDVKRTEADIQLLFPENPTGTFLVRWRTCCTAIRSVSTYRDQMILSVRTSESKSNDACVKHYRIHRLDNGCFFISNKKTFDNMLDLILHYQNGANGLCCKLDVPCPKIRPMVQFRELDVSRNYVKLQKKLGSGYFGEVWAGKWRDIVDIAVKTLKPSKMTPEAFLEEAELMYNLRHKKLLLVMAVCAKSKPIWVITELMAKGTLLDYLRKDGGNTITFNIITHLAEQIADGMAFLEARNFVHFNLRAANILIGEHYEVKVADFGLARVFEEDIYEAHEDIMFLIKWNAPEAAGGRKFSIKSDVWSYGVLLYELITCGREPYPGMKGNEVLNRVEKGYRMPRPTDGLIPCPEPYHELMLKCWNRSPDTRPTFAFLLDFFENYVSYTERTKLPIESQND
ncbi:tyrosine-protein kinase SRK3-like isoform X3 [Dreissena polymorpha]|uniref:tyrosine-protein kinase SRK3-like isoform X3 n=1 Tax=Dreissena polymorpha TaxID=45954 RepID=UPI0022651C83|nr:tyrosine-protein kinase SRK3-like isoform X3 [Dreissena polymorpha]